MDNRATIVLLALLIRSPSYAISPSCPTSADGLQRKPSLGAVPGRDSQHCGGMNAGHRRDVHVRRTRLPHRIACELISALGRGTNLDVAATDQSRPSRDQDGDADPSYAMHFPYAMHFHLPILAR